MIKAFTRAINYMSCFVRYAGRSAASFSEGERHESQGVQRLKSTIASQQGQTVIEVIVAVSLVVLVLTTLVAGIAVSVRNSRQAKNQAQAKEFVRQQLEWVRALRDSEGWETLRAAIQADGNGPRVYCLSGTLPSSVAAFSALPAAGSIDSGTGAIQGCSAMSSNPEFTRALSLDVIGSGGQIEAISIVQWGEAPRLFRSRSELSLFQY